MLISLIAILLLAKDSNLVASNLVNYLISNYGYPGLKGLIIGIVAMVMSPADSYINASAIIVSHDLLASSGFIKKEHQLVWARIGSIIIGAIGFFIATLFDSIFKLFIFGRIFYLSVIATSFMIALLGFRSSSKSVLIAMSAAFITVAISYFGFNRNGALEGMIANIVFLLGSHYLLKQEGGWVRTKAKDHVFRGFSKEVISQKKYIGLLKRLKTFNFFKFCVEQLPNNSDIPALYGGFYMLLLLANIWVFPSDREYNVLAMLIKISLLVISTILILSSLYVDKLKNNKYIGLVWLLLLLYTVPFVGIFQILLMNFYWVYVVTFLMSMIVMMLILRWYVSVVLLLIGGWQHYYVIM